MGRSGLVKIGPDVHGMAAAAGGGLVADLGDPVVVVVQVFRDAAGEDTTGTRETDTTQANRASGRSPCEEQTG